MQKMPWDEDWSGAGAGGQPVIMRGEAPPKPNLPQGWGLNPDGTASPVRGLPSSITNPEPKEQPETWRPLSPQEAQQRGLPAGGFQISSRGKVARIEGMGQGEGDDVNQQQKIASLDSLVGQINRVEDLYRKNIAGQPIDRAFGLTEFLPTQDNRQFDAAAAGLAEQGLSAFRVPGVGSQSDAELRQFIQANRPSASDYDPTVEEKLRQLRLRVDATREQMGLPPAEWLGQETDKAAVPGATAGGDQPPPRPDYSVLDPGGFNHGIAPTDPGSSTRKEFNAEASALIDKMVRQQIPYAKARKMFAELYPGAPPIPPGTYNKARAYSRQHPDYQGSFGYVEKEVPMGFLERAGNIVAQSGPGAAAATYFNAATGGVPAALAGDEGRYALDIMRDQNPGWTLGGEVAGNITGMIGSGKALKAATPILARVPGLSRAVTNPVGRNIAGDAVYGGVYGATSNPDDPLAGAAKGAGFAGAGSFVGNKVVNATGRAVSGVRNEGVRYLADRGVPMTIGDMVGGGGVVGRTVKGLESKLESMPFIGDAIKARRLAGYEGMNREAMGQALDPIGARSVAGVGEAGVEAGRTATGDAYKSALAGVNVAPDAPFVRQLGMAVTKGKNLPGSLKEDFGHVMTEYVAPALGSGSMTGEAYQAARQALRQESAAWKGKPNGQAMRNALKEVERSLEGLVRRQAPDVVPALNKADQAYRRFKTVENAVGRGVNTGGVFTPAQLGLAARQSGNKYGGSAATTERPFFELQRHSQDVLPSTVPNSGTADRAIGSALLPLSLGGAGVGFGLDPSTIAIMTALSLPYTQAGMAAAQKILVSRPDVVRKIGERIGDYSHVGGLIGGSGGAAIATNP